MQDKNFCILGSASLSNKAVNKDAHGIICNDKVKYRGIIVADGIGNNEKVEQASGFVVQAVKEQIEQLDEWQENTLVNAIENTAHAFEKEFHTITNPQFGTTLIAVIEESASTINKIKIAYVGNGAVWHIKGNFTNFSSPQLFPWNCINYLNPHSILENGREVLSNCISVNKKNYSGPGTIDISCDPEFGDIIMICTDGIYSNDQATYSEDGFGDTWVQCDNKVKIFLRYLANFFKLPYHSGESMNEMLESYLEELRANNFLDDDASVGVLLTTQALNYQKKLDHESGDKH